MRPRTVKRAYQAICTRYLPPTDILPARVRATANAGSFIANWDDGKDTEANHARAAEGLADRFGWLDRGAVLVPGGLPQTANYALVFVLLYPEDLP